MWGEREKGGGLKMEKERGGVGVGVHRSEQMPDRACISRFTRSAEPRGFRRCWLHARDQLWVLARPARPVLPDEPALGQRRATATAQTNGFTDFFFFFFLQPGRKKKTQVEHLRWI